MKPGTTFSRRGQAYRCVGVTDHRRQRDGQFMELLVLESRCAECGAPFTLKGSRSNAQKGHLNRRCDRHKKQGSPVQRPQPPTLRSQQRRVRKAERRLAKAIAQRDRLGRLWRSPAKPASAARRAALELQIRRARPEVAKAQWNLRDARLSLEAHENIELLKRAGLRRLAQEQTAALAAADAKVDRTAGAEARRQAAQAAREERQRRREATAAEKRQRDAARAADAAQRELARLLGTEPATIAPDGPLAGALADVEARHRADREADAERRHLIDDLFERPRPVGGADANLAHLLE